MLGVDEAVDGGDEEGLLANEVVELAELRFGVVELLGEGFELGPVSGGTELGELSVQLGEAEVELTGWLSTEQVLPIGLQKGGEDAAGELERKSGPEELAEGLTRGPSVQGYGLRKEEGGGAVRHEGAE